MNKFIALFLACAIVLAIIPALAEEDAISANGNWYAVPDGIVITLVLSPEGSYTYTVPAMPDMDRTGTWEYRDGFVYMDGDETAPLSYNGPTLTNGDLGLFFTREEPVTYSPADLLTEAPAALFAGAWQTAYVMQNGYAVPADTAEANTLIYIEEAKAILKGGSFGYRIVDLAFENGAFSCDAEDITVRMELQQDGFLRLTVEKDGQADVLILGRTALPGLDPDTAE